jgi:phage-related baseplate assembly protein
MATKIQFVDTNADTILNEFIADYESLSGKKLQPAQAERLLIQAATNRLVLQRIAINETANKNFLAFANGKGLELLAELLGVYRLPAASAECVIRFNLISGHGAFAIPAGIRVQSIDGQLVFVTTEGKNVSVDDTYVDIQAACTEEGTKGNDYAAGEVSVILDPQAYVTSAANQDTTNGGSDQETDDELRERMYLAPSRFSVAGPSDAYKFFAKSAHPTIIDVAVKDHTPDPGDVTIYPLCLDGELPSTEVKDAVAAACSAKNVRPLNDTVYVEDPTEITYAISLEVKILNTADQATVEALIDENLQAYIDYRKTKLGVDVVKSQLIKAASVDGVYSVTVIAPVADIEADENEFTTCTGTTVSVTDTVDE